MSSRRPSIAQSVANRHGLHARWGRLDVTPELVVQARNRRNVTLEIYPPGTTKRERIMLAIRSAGTSWDGLGLLTLPVLIAGVWLGTLGAVATLLVALTAWGLAAWAARRAQRHTRRVRIFGTVDYVGGQVDLFSAAAGELDALDDRGDLDPVEYERQWWLIYEQAAPPPSDGDQS